MKPILNIENLTKIYGNVPSQTKALNGITFQVMPGEFLGIMGSSGSGKSTLLNCIATVIQPTGGSIQVEGDTLQSLKGKALAEYRGKKVGYLFQNFELLDNLTGRENILLPTSLHGVSEAESRQRLKQLADYLEITDVLDKFPSKMSGGQRQRVLIAMALTRDPKLVICDEPTTALDVTVQKQVIKLLNDLQAKLGFAMIFVSHDLALVAEVAHNITVMYAGQVIEQAPTKELLTNPIHEYTRGLLGSVLSIESGSGRLHQVPGAVPSPRDFPKGDRFAPRSSHPRIGLDTRPVFKRVPGTEHFYSELPDEVLKANGLTPHAEVM